MEKRLYDISWQVDEAAYRQDKALSYSTIAKFTREGFNNLTHLFDKVETPSLTFGSAVDAIITGGQEEFDKNFIVADFPETPDTIVKIVKDCFKEFSTAYRNLSDIPDAKIIDRAAIYAYQNNWKPETRAKVIKEKGEEYYRLLYIAGGKTILNTELNQVIKNAVNALQTSEATKFYFAPNNPFDTRYYREYQLKFKASFDEVSYRCMSDLLITDYQNKIVYPIDLKTSSHTEWDFYDSFIQWCYYHQARLYWRIIRATMDKDPFFKEFKLADYKFIVVNKNTLTPLVWEYKDTQKTGTLYYGKNNQIVCRDPFDVGKELSYYLHYNPAVPKDITIKDPNDIIKFLNLK